jgi:hypothetical protein
VTLDPYQKGPADNRISKTYLIIVRDFYVHILQDAFKQIPTADMVILQNENTSQDGITTELRGNDTEKLALWIRWQECFITKDVDDVVNMAEIFSHNDRF